MKKLLGILVLGLLSIILAGCNEKSSKIKIEKVLLFGDSLMAGYGLPEEEHLSVVLEQSLRSEGHDIEIINGSVSGSTSLDGLNRAEETLSELSIDLIVLGLGANDMLRRIKPKETKQNLEKIGIKHLNKISIGRYIEIQLDNAPEKELKKNVQEAVDRLLHNSIIEDYEIIYE